MRNHIVLYIATYVLSHAIQFADYHYDDDHHHHHQSEWQETHSSQIHDAAGGEIAKPRRLQGVIFSDSESNTTSPPAIQNKASWFDYLFNRNLLGNSNAATAPAVPSPSEPRNDGLKPSMNSDKIMLANLYGNIANFAYYFVDVRIGTPPQLQSLILDSGSALLGLACTKCRVCGRHVDALFDINTSSTAVHYSCNDPTCQRSCSRPAPIDTCMYTQSYTEGSSISGFFFSDLVSLGDAKDHNVPVRYDYLGCHSRETNLFTTQKASGIMGLSYPKYSVRSGIMDTIFKSGTVESQVFTICLAEEGGQFTVGGYNTAYHRASRTRPGADRASSFTWWLPFFKPGKAASSSLGYSSTDRKPIGTTNKDESTASAPANVNPSLRGSGAASRSVPIAWTDVVSDDSYTVQPVRMFFDGVEIARDHFGETSVDSGTTYSYFPPLIYDQIESALLKHCAQHSKCRRVMREILCWYFDGESDAEIEEQLKSLPSFELHFVNGAVVEWQARSYLYKKGARSWCTGIDRSDRQETLLGMSFVKNVDVIYDRENNQIGFVSADCPKHTLEERPSSNGPEFANKTFAAEVEESVDDSVQAAEGRSVSAVVGGRLIRKNGKFIVSNEREGNVESAGEEAWRMLERKSSLANNTSAGPEEFHRFSTLLKQDTKANEKKLSIAWTAAGLGGVACISGLGLLVARQIGIAAEAADADDVCTSSSYSPSEEFEQSEEIQPPASSPKNRRGKLGHTIFQRGNHRGQSNYRALAIEMEAECSDAGEEETAIDSMHHHHPNNNTTTTNEHNNSSFEYDSEYDLSNHQANNATTR